MALNLGMQKLNLTPLDFTQEKLYTLTDESKEKVKNIDKTINIYFVGYTDSDSNLDLAKQYNKVNDKITAEAVDANNRPDLTQKYGIESGSQGIIVECGEKSKVLTSQDLVSYDTSTYETVSVAEQKLTGAIVSVSTDKVPKVYFLEGYSDFSLSQNMTYLKMLLANEINEIDTLNILTTGKVPDDCDTLVITTPLKDFDDVATTAITDYINSGKNILWLNAAQTAKTDLTNVNKILALYGINPFEVGYVYETDNSRTALGYASCIVEDLGSTDIAKKLTDAVLLNATKINVNTDELTNLGVTEQAIISTSSTSYFRKNVSNTASGTDGDEQGGFTVGGIFTKKISNGTEENEDETSENNSEENAITSTLVIFGDNNFVSDIQITSQVNPMVFLANNKDLMLNSIAYLTNNDEDITIRKDYTKSSDFTPTDGQKLTIVRIIFIVPIAIILLGFIVWQVRRRKK